MSEGHRSHCDGAEDRLLGALALVTEAASRHVLPSHCDCLLQVIINSTITPNMTFTKTSQKFGQWADSRANTVFGLGFSSEQQLTKVMWLRLQPGGCLSRGEGSEHWVTGFLSGLPVSSSWASQGYQSRCPF